MTTMVTEAMVCLIFLTFEVLHSSVLCTMDIGKVCPHGPLCGFSICLVVVVGVGITEEVGIMEDAEDFGEGVLLFKSVKIIVYRVMA